MQGDYPYYGAEKVFKRILMVNDYIFDGNTRSWLLKTNGERSSTSDRAPVLPKLNIATGKGSGSTITRTVIPPGELVPVSTGLSVPGVVADWTSQDTDHRGAGSTQKITPGLMLNPDPVCCAWRDALLQKFDEVAK